MLVLFLSALFSVSQRRSVTILLGNDQQSSGRGKMTKFDNPPDQKTGTEKPNTIGTKKQDIGKSSLIPESLVKDMPKDTQNREGVGCEKAKDLAKEIVKRARSGMTKIKLRRHAVRIRFLKKMSLKVRQRQIVEFEEKQGILVGL